MLPDRLVLSNCFFGLVFAVPTVLAGVLLLAPGVAVAAEPPVTVEADKLEYEDSGQVIKAEGKVVVEWNGNRLEADRVTVEQEARTLDAAGDMIFESPLLKMRADSCRLNVDDETGSLSNVLVLPEDREGRFGASQIEKLEGRTYRLTDGFFTTCALREGGSPDWELTGEEIEIELDGYGRLDNGALRVRGVPVVYLPAAVFPTKTTRQSGLLRPTLGSSNERGFVFSQPWYWAIDKHQDLTMSAEVQTDARLGTTVQYRARHQRNSWSKLSGAYYNESNRVDNVPDGASPQVQNKHIGEDRGFVDVGHRQDFQGRNLQFYADVMATTDDLVLREVDSFDTGNVESEYRRTLRYGRSTAGLLGWNGGSSYGVAMEGRQNFYGEDDSTLQRPLGAWARSDGAIGKVAFELSGDVDGFTREEGVDGQRVMTVARATMPLVTTPAGSVRTWVAGRGLGYHLDERQVYSDEGELEDELDSELMRGMVSAGIEARSKAARSYRLGAGRLLRHTVEPFAGLTTSSDSSLDEVPLFDRHDFYAGRDMVRVGVDSGFFMKDAEGSVVEVARLALLSGYSLNEDVIDDGFTDVDLAAFLRATETLSLRTLTSVSPSAGQLSGAQASVLWEPGPVGLLSGQDNRLGLAYRFVRGGILESSEGRVRFAFTNTFSLGFKGRYDFESETFVEKGGSFRISAPCDCWAIDLGVMTRANPDETQIRFLVELAGIGDVGRSLASRSSPAMDEIDYEDLGFWRAGW